MKKKILVMLSAFMVLFFLAPVSVHGAEDEGASDIIGQAKQQLSAIFENIDQETAEEAFSFLKEQLKEGNLDTEEGLLEAIEEGKEKFGVEVSKEDAQNLVDTMERLEGMGFSAEYVVEKTENLYQQYGNDFVDHVDEVITGAVKNAASNALGSFFSNLADSVKNFFRNLFS